MGVESKGMTEPDDEAVDSGWDDEPAPPGAAIYDEARRIELQAMDAGELARATARARAW